MLTHDQIAAYRRDGYLKLVDVLTTEQLSAARRVMDDFVERSRALSRSDDVIDLEDDHTPENPRIRRLKDPHRASPAFDRPLRDHPSRHIGAQVIRPGIGLHQTKLNAKPPGGG